MSAFGDKGTKIPFHWDEFSDKIVREAISAFLKQPDACKGTNIHDFMTYVKDAVKQDGGHLSKETLVGAKLWYIRKFFPFSVKRCSARFFVLLFSAIHSNSYQPLRITENDLSAADAHVKHMIRWTLLVRRCVFNYCMTRYLRKHVDITSTRFFIHGLKHYGVGLGRMIPNCLISKIQFFHECSWCGRISHKNDQYFLKCGRCRVNRYCSKMCQQMHWKSDHACICMPREDNIDLYRQKRKTNAAALMLRLMAPVFVDVVSKQLFEGRRTPFFQFYSYGPNSLMYDIIPLRINKELLSFCWNLNKDMLRHIINMNANGGVQFIVVLWSVDNFSKFDPNARMQDRHVLHTLVPVSGFMMTDEDNFIVDQFFTNIKSMWDDMPAVS